MPKPKAAKDKYSVRRNVSFRPDQAKLLRKAGVRPANWAEWSRAALVAAANRSIRARERDAG